MENVKYGQNLPEDELMTDDFNHRVAIECEVIPFKQAFRIIFIACVHASRLQVSKSIGQSKHCYYCIIYTIYIMYIIFAFMSISLIIFKVSKQPAKYYWYRKVLDISPTIEEPGNFSPYLFLCLTIAWILTWAILIKGIKSSEKVVFFTALFPYVTLVIFFIANFFQDGWKNGYTILFDPDVRNQSFMSKYFLLVFENCTVS
jgi:hypothetical protein